MIAKTPSPPYYAVIFSSLQTESIGGYTEAAELLEALAKNIEGYLGIESARNHLGITVSYWNNLEAIKQWKEDAVHLVAQKKGKEEWYKAYQIRIAKVERDYCFDKP